MRLRCVDAQPSSFCSILKIFLISSGDRHGQIPTVLIQSYNPGLALQTYMVQVYGWMTVGLLLTAFVARYAANSAAVMELRCSLTVSFNRSDHRAISIGYCVISDDSKS